MRHRRPKIPAGLIGLLWSCSAVFAQAPATNPPVRDVLDKAMRSAKSALDGNVKKETFPILAGLWAQADSVEAVPRIRELVESSGGFVDGLKRATVMMKLARYQGRVGDREHALATLDRAKRDADGAIFVVTSDFWTYFWSEMPGPEIIGTRTYTRDDLVAEMNQIRQEIDSAAPSGPPRVSRYRKTEAAPPANQEDPQIEEARRLVARLASGDGAWNDALGSIKLVKSPLKRVDLLCRAAETASKASNQQLAATAYEAARNECSRMNIFNPKDRTAGFVRLASSMASTGHFTQARKLTSNLLDARVRGQMKRLIAYAETIRGGGTSALKWVDSEWVADARAYGLIGIAEALLGRGFPADSVE